MILKSFYHIACMNNWKDVVIEQKEVCDSVGIVPVCGVLGSLDDVVWIKDLGLDIAYHSSNILEYETPTLKMLYDWSKSNKDGAILYFHTKGVSVPTDVVKKYWRWLMMDNLVLKWKTNIIDLISYDAIGVSFLKRAKRPHFPGNFWIASVSYINTLIDPIKHKLDGGPAILGNPWNRMHAECWIGTKPNANMKSLLGHNRLLSNLNFPYYNKYKG